MEIQMLKALKTILFIFVISLLGACASGVTRMDGVALESMPKIDKTVKSVNVNLSNDAKKLLADNMQFNQDTLRSTIERSLNAQNLIKVESSQSLDIEITSFRVRSAFAAVMFGIMAGHDNVEGVVSIKGVDGKVLKPAKVSATYALGGVMGGNEVRMSWLYEEFAKHTVSELSGISVK
jgi:hypothetical protein